MIMGKKTVCRMSKCLGARILRLWPRHLEIVGLQDCRLILVRNSAAFEKCAAIVTCSLPRFFCSVSDECLY